MKAQPRSWRLFAEKGASQRIDIEIIDEGDGDYIELNAIGGSVSFNPDEWDDLRAAIEHAILHIDKK